MNRKQYGVRFISLLLLTLNFIFPYSSSAKIETAEDGVSIRSTVQTGFLPFWEIQRRHKDAVVKGNPFGDTYILWHWVLLFAVGIIVFTVVTIHRLQESPESQESHSQIPASPDIPPEP